MKRALSALALLPFIAGCYTIHYVYEAPSTPMPNQETWHHRFAWGIVELESPVILDMMCPGGIAQIQTQVSGLNGLADIGLNMVVSTVTGGLLSWVDLYSPSTISVWCADGQAYRGTLEPDGLVYDVEALPPEPAIPGFE